MNDGRVTVKGWTAPFFIKSRTDVWWVLWYTSNYVLPRPSTASHQLINQPGNWIQMQTPTWVKSWTYWSLRDMWACFWELAGLNDSTYEHVDGLQPRNWIR